MKTFLTTGAALTAALVLFSCGAERSQPASQEGASTAKPEQAKPATAKAGREAGVFALDETAQSRIHLAIEPVREKNLAETISAPGDMDLDEGRVWRVGALVGGRVESFTVRLGDAVRSGQVIARIHSHDEHEARAAYQEALTELNRAKAAQGYAAQKRDRAKRLLDLRAGSRQDLENAEAEVTNAQAAIDKAQAEVTRESTHLTDILHVPLSGERAGGNADEGIPIVAPASGIVIDRKATEGSVVNSGDEMLKIADTSTLWMIAAVKESDLASVHPGQAVRIQVRAWPNREFPGTVLKLGEQMNAETRALQVRVSVPNPQGLLKPEMYATALFRQAQNRPALLVPEEAVQDINGVTVVFLRRSAMEFESRPVKTGQHANGEAEILEGLKPGDSVVVKGSFMLKSELLKSSIGE